MDKVQRKLALRSNSSSGSIGENRAKIYEHKTDGEKVNCHSPKLARRNSAAGLYDRRKTSPLAQIAADVKPEPSQLKTKSAEFKGKGVERKLMRSGERDEMENSGQVAADSEDIGICEEKRVVIVDDINETGTLENCDTEEKKNGEEESITADDKCEEEISNPQQETANKPDEISLLPKKVTEAERQEIIKQSNGSIQQEIIKQSNGSIQQEIVKQSNGSIQQEIVKQSNGSIHSISGKPVGESVQKFGGNGRGDRRLQSLVDLVMWENAARSSFVFGIGTFLITSLSCTDALNFSFISVVSYAGLFYLATRFLYKSLLSKVEYTEDDEYVIGEDEAACVLRWVVPFVNELLFSTKALFSGDPATTMKMSVILFVIARCGSSITIWNLCKIGFFGVFTLPKFYSSYQAQFSAHVEFWFRRFRDVWNGCSHKKAVAFAVFALVWNLLSVIARAWALFMMFVALRYYKLGVAGCQDGPLVGANCDILKKPQ